MFTVDVPGLPAPLTVTHRDGVFTVGARANQPALVREDAYTWVLLHNGQTYRVLVHGFDPVTRQLQVRVNGLPATLTVTTHEDNLLKVIGRERSAAMRQTALTAPMPGLIVDVHIQPGQELQPGDPLLVLEAMKMQNVLKAAEPATVKAVHAVAGQNVAKGAVLVEFE